MGITKRRCVLYYVLLLISVYLLPYDVHFCLNITAFAIFFNFSDMKTHKVIKVVNLGLQPTSFVIDLSSINPLL